MIKKTTLEKSKAEYQAKIDAIPKPLILVPYEEVLRLVNMQDETSYLISKEDINKLDVYEYIEEKVVYRG